MLPNLPKLPATSTQAAGTQTIEIALVTIRKDVLAKQRKQLFAGGMGVMLALVLFVNHYGKDEPKASAATTTPSTVIAATPAGK